MLNSKFKSGEINASLAAPSLYKIKSEYKSIIQLYLNSKLLDEEINQRVEHLHQKYSGLGGYVFKIFSAVTFCYFSLSICLIQIPQESPFIALFFFKYYKSMTVY